MTNILIVEDDVYLAEGIEFALEDDDFKFVHCKTIKDSKKKIDNNIFDLIILDINLPDGNGFDFCKEIRKMSKVPIILLTARDMEVDIVRGLEYGADDYITKPFSIMILRSRIRALLRRNNIIENNYGDYNKGKFVFKFTSMKFYKDNILIELSKTEQRILYILVSNENIIITRERLLGWVWPDGTEYVEDNALSVGIKRLREKLEDNFSRPKYIKTIYGKGYIWENRL